MRSGALKVERSVSGTGAAYLGLDHHVWRVSSDARRRRRHGVSAASDAPLRPPYSALADVYDEIMQDVPYDAWCDFVRRELAQRGWRGRRLLDLGCGTGRAGEPYRRHGFDVLGVDPAEAMVRAARRRDPSGRYLVGDARTLDLGERFDLVIAVFDALNNLTGDGELRQACERVAAHLVPGGAFAFDVNTSVGLQALWEDDVAEGWAGDVYYRWEHSWDPARQRARVVAYCRGPRGAFVEHHEERPFEPAEVEAALRAAGFVSVDVVAYPDGERAEDDAPRVWAIARLAS